MAEATPPASTPDRKVRNSGRRLVITLTVSFAIATALVLLVLRLPALVEWWFVTAAWWLIWFFTIANLLYRGGPVRDDYRWTGPRSWFRRGTDATTSPLAETPASRAESPASKKDGLDWLAWLPDVGCASAAELLGVIALVLAAAAAAYFMAWIVVELLIPIAALVVYVHLHGMLALAAAASGRCRRDVRRTIAFAAGWATVYSAPLALVLWLCSFAQRR